ncbi:partial Extracellular ribonuclease, partial [Anaerolineae bacterium]
MIRKAYTVFRCSADRATAPSSLCIESDNKTSFTSKAYIGAKSHCEPGSFAPSLPARSGYRFSLLLFFLLSLIPGAILPQAGTYYDAVSVGETSFPYQLKQRVRSPYTKVSYDNFDETNVANFSSYSLGGSLRGVRCVYSYYEHQYTGTFAWGTMSREHTFCHSWMPSHPSESTNEYSDQHHLFPTHQNGANGVRSNHPLGWVTNITSSFLEGKYGKDSSNNNVYEPRNPHKGDAARALLYMCIRYDSASGSARWTFDWLNTTRLPSLSEGPQSLQTLLTWHFQDPPDKWEVDRNNYIQSIQGNRNPFVDRPEFVNYINFNNLSYVSRTYAAEPTNYPTSVAAVPSGSNLTVSWTDAVTGSQAPAAYLIVLYNRDNYFLPIDGEVYADDTDLSDGRGVITVLHSGSDQYTFTGLPSATYYATVYSVNGSGTQTNYKINGTLPRANATVSGSTVTQVSFVTTSATVGEGSGTYQLQVQLVN